jgi:choice-of-anchor C domain-containing protein
MRSRLLLLSIAATLALTTHAETDNLIVNGSFEHASINTVSYKDVPAGSNVIEGWTVTLNHIDYVGAGLWAPSEGRHSLDLEGSACDTHSTTACLGGVKQTFPTEAGQTYEVSFDLAGNVYAGPKIKTLKVSAAGQSQTFTFDITGHNAANMGWRTEHWVFTAAEEHTTLEFESTDRVPGLSGWGPALDNVIVRRRRGAR